MEIQDIAKFLIDPLFYIFIGLLSIIFFKKHRLQLTILLGIYIYFISITFTGQAFSKFWRVEDTYNPSIKYDAVVVTAGVTDSSWYLNRKGLPYVPNDFFATNEDSERILAGIYFVKSGHAKSLLFGEWINDIFNETDVVKKLASDMKLKDNQVWIYGQIKRTLDEARCVKLYLEKHPIRKLLLVTSQRHMRRALAMFRKQGLNPDVFSAPKEVAITGESFIPDITGIIKTESYLYEVIGYIGYYVKGDL